MNIKRYCYLMDESIFGLHISNILNKVFGVKETTYIERAYINENLEQEESDVSDRNTYKSRRLGIGCSPLLQIIPVIGNYIVLALNLWILYSMINVGMGFRVQCNRGKIKIDCESGRRFINLKDVGKMMFNILVDFGIGFIPIIGMFVGIIHRSSSRNLAIFWKSLEKKYLQ